MIIISVHLASGCRCCLHARWRFVCRASVCRAWGVGDHCLFLVVWGPSVHRRPGSDGLVLVDVCEVAVGSCEDDILFLCCIQYKSIHD